MEISKTYNPEFDNLLRLLSSTDEPNVSLGLQLARNYATEIEAHFGCTPQDLEALFHIIMRHDAWNFKMAFWEVEKLNLLGDDMTILPEVIYLLKNLKDLILRDNKLQVLHNLSCVLYQAVNMLKL